MRSVTWQQSRSTTQASGFSLVELLVVIGIIAVVIVAFAMPAALRPTGPGVNGSIKLEVAKIEQGLETYKNKHNDYPPDFSDASVVRRHFRKAFPKMAADEKLILEHLITNETIDRAEALVFALHGYSSDDTHPLTGPGGPLDATDPESFVAGSTTLGGSMGMTNSLISFEEQKLDWTYNTNTQTYTSTDGDGDVFATYRQRGSETPFVYFDSRSYVHADPADPSRYVVNHFRHATDRSIGIAQPYKSSELAESPRAIEALAWRALPDGRNPSRLLFANPGTFQIIAAGADGKFGTSPASIQPAEARVYPEGIGYENEDLDNIVNFSDRATLAGDMP